MLLFRPIGLNELRLIVDARFRAFPPRGTTVLDCAA